MMETFFFGKHLEEDEHLTMVVHKHWALGLRVLVFPVISFIFSWALLSRWGLDSAEQGRVMVSLVALWSGASLVWLLRNFLDYYLDAWVITDHGVIDLEWRGWFHRHSSRILYSDIQGVSYEIHGVLGTLLRYGTVSIEKISTGSVVSLENVPRPRSVESAILKNMETYLHGKNLKNAKHVQELLAEFVSGQVNEGAVNDVTGNTTRERLKKPEPRVTKKSFSSSRIGSSRSE